jgi:predicted transposase/invertase (TIGR01784 family)
MSGFPAEIGGPVALMDMAIFTPHDRLFHSTFRRPRFVAAWLRHVLPPAIVAAVAWDTLVPASEHAVGLRLRSHFADLVFAARLIGSDEEVLLILEHKADPDAGLRSQVLRYSVHLRRLAMKRGEREPLVVAVVLHHAHDPFRHLEAPHHPAFASLQPHVDFVVDDLCGSTEDELRRPALPAQAQLTLLALATLRRFTNSDVLGAIDRWGDLLRAIDGGDGEPTPDDALDAFAEYVLETTDVSSEDLQMAFSKNLSKPDTSIMTTAQRLRSEGQALGHSKGLTQGLIQGLTQGQMQTLLRLLTRKFGGLPPELLHRLTNANQAELDLWTDRVLDAKSLTDVFAG